MKLRALVLLALTACASPTLKPEPARSPASVQRTCRDIFGSYRLEAIAATHDLLAEFPFEHFYPSASQQRVSQTESVYTESFGYSTTDVAHHWDIAYYAPAPVSLRVPPVPPSVSKEAHRQFRRTRNEAMRFVLGHYAERRGHWSPAFLKKLLKMAEEWEPQSTYITSRTKPVRWNADLNRANNTRDPMVVTGSIRLIRERDGRLPMEDYLGIRIRNPAGTLKVEPGNLAVEKVASEIVSVELALGVVGQNERYRRETGRNAFLTTYADAFSEKLYAPLGFKPTTRDMLEVPSEILPFVHEDPVTGAIRIEREGVRWAPMYASSEMVQQTVSQRLMLSARRYKRDKFAEQIQSLLERAQIKPEAFSHSGWGRFRNVSGPGSIYMTRLPNGRAEVGFHLPGEVGNVYRHPVEITLPIPEGFKAISVMDETVSYQNGVLRIEQAPKYQPDRLVTVAEITVDPNFERPVRLRYGLRIGAKEMESADVEF